MLQAAGFVVQEVEARAVNAEPWEPMLGMEKRQCPACRYFFAALPDVKELRCPDCLRLGGWGSASV